MLRTSVALIGLTIICATLALGCRPAENRSARVPRTNIITGSTGSTWYMVGSALAEKANLPFDGHPITAVPGAGGVSNPVRVSMSGTDLGISYGPFLAAAYRGEAPFHEPIPRLRVVASLILNTLHVLAQPRLELASVRDLTALNRSVRLGSGPPGSGDLFCLSALLEILGSDLDAWQQEGHVLRLAATGQRFDDWKDGRLDIAITFVNDPSPQLTELMVSRPARFLSIPEDLRHSLRERWGFVALTVAPGSYPNQGDAVETVGLPSILFTVAEVDDAIVYAVVKALYENQDYMQKVHPGFERWDRMVLPDDLEIPLHPGAARYYREVGLIEEELAGRQRGGRSGLLMDEDPAAREEAWVEFVKADRDIVRPGVNDFNEGLGDTLRQLPPLLLRAGVEPFNRDARHAVSFMSGDLMIPRAPARLKDPGRAGSVNGHERR